MGRTEREIVEKIFNVPYWRQRITIDTSKGIVATPGRSTTEKYKYFMLSNISNKSILDIGSWDGLHASLAEEDGGEVTAIDVYEGGGDNPQHWHSLRKGSKDQGIRTVRELKSQSFDIRSQSIYGIPDEETYDVVLFPSVLYHLQNPIRALEKIRTVTDELAVIETITHPLSRPGMELVPGDGTPWAIPNIEGLEALLDMAGFRCFELVSRGFDAHKNKFIYVNQGSEIRRPFIDEVVRPSETVQGRILAKSKDYTHPRIPDRSVYVEIEIDGTLVQGWVRKSDCRHPTKEWMDDKETLLQDMKWFVGQRVLKRELLGSRVREWFGIGTRVVFHAHV